MSIVVFGESGQLAQALAATSLPAENVFFASRAVCDLSVSGAVTQLLESEQPDWIVNAAGYTAVDKAESEPELAHQINAAAVEEMAAWAVQVGAKLIHVSTDFVFSGEQSEPYLPGDPASPIGVYGLSKHAGELAVLAKAPENTMVIRTSWVYFERGQNFVNTMLRLMAERDELNVVNDQIGSPTYAVGLAETIWRIVSTDRFSAGIYHWSDAGGISWYEFALAIQAGAAARGLLTRSIPILAIPASQYPTPAARPGFSVMDTQKLETLLGIQSLPWRSQLDRMLDSVNI